MAHQTVAVTCHVVTCIPPSIRIGDAACPRQDVDEILRVSRSLEWLKPFIVVWYSDKSWLYLCVTVPPYHSKHQVIAAPWSYTKDALTGERVEEDASDKLKIIDKQRLVDLGQGPPSYQESKGPGDEGKIKVQYHGHYLSENLREMTFSWKIRGISGKLRSTWGIFGKCQNVREISGNVLAMAEFGAEHGKRLIDGSLYTDFVIWIFSAFWFVQKKTRKKQQAFLHRG